MGDLDIRSSIAEQFAYVWPLLYLDAEDPPRERNRHECAMFLYVALHANGTRFLRLGDRITTRFLKRIKVTEEMMSQYFSRETVNSTRRRASCSSSRRAWGKHADEWQPAEGEIHVPVGDCTRDNPMFYLQPNAEHAFDLWVDRLFQWGRRGLRSIMQTCGSGLDAESHGRWWDGWKNMVFPVREELHQPRDQPPLPSFDRVLMLRRRCSVPTLPPTLYQPPAPHK